MRVPTADETAESVRRAQRALQELKNRQAAEARHAEDQAVEDMSRWHADQESRTTDSDRLGRPINQEDGREAFVLDAFV